MEIRFGVEFIFGRPIFWVLRRWEQRAGNQGLALGAEERGDTLHWADWWAWEGGEQPDPPAGAFLGAGVQLTHFGGSAQLNLPLTGWGSHYSEAGSIYIIYPYSEAASAYKFGEARACIYILGRGKAAFKEPGGGGGGWEAAFPSALFV